MGPLASDRIAGGLLVALGALVAWEARTFRVAFLTDPVGPRALPLLVAALLAGGGLVLLLRPSPGRPWPEGGALVRVGAAALVFALYSMLLEPIGFALTTPLAVSALGILFRGPPLRTLITGISVTVILWLLFALALGIPLPGGIV